MPTRIQQQHPLFGHQNITAPPTIRPPEYSSSTNALYGNSRALYTIQCCWTCNSSTEQIINRRLRKTYIIVERRQHNLINEGEASLKVDKHNLTKVKRQ